MVNKMHHDYNPDVLSCLANLSSDEVFTPPDVVNKMLDLLPKELFQNKEIRFLDPFTKSGVFLREIAKRLILGLEELIPDLHTRVNHIFQNQLFGIAITELTSLLSRRSLYCTKYPNSNYSVAFFEDVEGNIRFKIIQHTWNNGKCVYCGASRQEYDREEGLEAHAYEFIHTGRPERIFNMEFDVIIGNPPYQLSDSGFGMSAKPIYHLFIEQSKKMNPRYLCMIIPARWYAGGKGLNSFRETMLSDNRIRKLVDYESSKEIFTGVDIAGGICYFLWDRDNPGICEVVNHNNGKFVSSRRRLNEFDIFVRNERAVEIIRKVQRIHTKEGRYLDSVVSSRKPFGLPTNYLPRNVGIPCWFTQKIGLRFADPKDVVDASSLLKRWKVLIPPAPIAGQTDFSKPVGFYYPGNTRIAAPGECCTESWLVAGSFKSEEEAISFRSYLFTKIVRFLLLQTVVSQHVTKQNFRFVPCFENYFLKTSDEHLKNIWGISNEEWEFIDSRITSVDGE